MAVKTTKKNIKNNTKNVSDKSKVAKEATKKTPEMPYVPIVVPFPEGPKIIITDPEDVKRIFDLFRSFFRAASSELPYDIQNNRFQNRDQAYYVSRLLNKLPHYYFNNSTEGPLNSISWTDLKYTFDTLYANIPEDFRDNYTHIEDVKDLSDNFKPSVQKCNGTKSVKNTEITTEKTFAEKCKLKEIIAEQHKIENLCDLVKRTCQKCKGQR